MTEVDIPYGLQKKGGILWREMQAITDFNPAELVLLEEACRIADRLDCLDDVLAGGEFVRLKSDDANSEIRVIVDSALSEARQQANIFKQLITALRIPDAKTGQKPQHRGARGAYKTNSSGASVSALDRFRQASGA